MDNRIFDNVYVESYVYCVNDRMEEFTILNKCLKYYKDLYGRKIADNRHLKVNYYLASTKDYWKELICLNKASRYRLSPRYLDATVFSNITFIRNDGTSVIYYIAGIYLEEKYTISIGRKYFKDVNIPTRFYNSDRFNQQYLRSLIPVEYLPNHITIKLLTLLEILWIELGMGYKELDFDRIYIVDDELKINDFKGVKFV